MSERDPLLCLAQIWLAWPAAIEAPHSLEGDESCSLATRFGKSVSPERRGMAEACSAITRAIVAFWHHVQRNMLGCISWVWEFLIRGCT
jgi:hypothetical protein